MKKILLSLLSVALLAQPSYCFNIFKVPKKIIKVIEIRVLLEIGNTRMAGILASEPL